MAKFLIEVPHAPEVVACIPVPDKDREAQQVHDGRN